MVWSPFEMAIPISVVAIIQYLLFIQYRMQICQRKQLFPLTRCGNTDGNQPGIIHYHSFIYMKIGILARADDLCRMLNLSAFERAEPGHPGRGELLYYLLFQIKRNVNVFEQIITIKISCGARWMGQYCVRFNKRARQRGGHLYSHFSFRN